MASKFKNEKKNKHLTHQDRREIEYCLKSRMNFKQIAQLIGKDPTTISYEVKRHRAERILSYTSDETPCSDLLKAPYVCNGCPWRAASNCHHVRYIYSADSAYKEYKDLLTDAREGIPLNKEEFYETDRIISSGLKAGQHLYHIMANSPTITCSKSTVYRHFQKGYYSASVLDLPRVVKFKARKRSREKGIPKGLKVGRTFNDFIAYTEREGAGRHTELDTVIGRIGGKVILTIHFVSCNFMVGLLLENKTSLEAATKIKALKNKLRQHNFGVKEVFSVLLADNGSEFADVFSFEQNKEGDTEINLFFCDPMTPSQKPCIEKNHTLFRDIVPKGSSFDDFTQKTVNLIFSHVNAVSRAKYGGKSAYDMFCFLYSEKLANLLGITYIPPKEVVQSPALLKGVVDLKKNI